MKQNTKRVLYLVAALLLVGVVVVSNATRSNRRVRAVRVEVAYGGADTLVIASTLVEQTLSQMPTLQGMRIKEVSTEQVRAVVSRNPYVSDVRVETSVGGDVEVRVVQRRPIVQLFCHGAEFYMDDRGRYLPMSAEGYANVLVANGHFRGELPDASDSISIAVLDTLCPDVAQMWHLASYLYHHPEYGVLFDQAYRMADGDYCLVPKVGNHVVVLGQVEHLDKKLHDLLVFYREGMNKVGWETYSQISLKYENQVVCTRRTAER